jgi:NADH-quinone oxidoreductase subunit N
MMLFIGLEIGSISLYALAGLNRSDSFSNEAALKYFIFGSFASAILVYGIALMYTALSATGFYETSRTIAYIGKQNVPLTAIVGLALFTFGLLFKVSAAPFHAWAPDVYQGAPTAYVGYMAAVVKGASFVVLARLSIIVFPLLSLNRSIIFAIISISSVVIGSFFAITQTDLKRLIAYSGIAQAGLIFSGISSGGHAVTASLFYLATYIFQLVGLFIVISIATDGFSSTIELDMLKGRLKKNPFLGVCFSIFLLGLAGMPLTSGFIAKFLLFTNLWAADLYVWVIVFLLASVLGFYFYLKPIWTLSIEETESDVVLLVSRTNSIILSVLALLTIILGIVPSSLLNIANWVVSSYL